MKHNIHIKDICNDMDSAFCLNHLPSKNGILLDMKNNLASLILCLFSMIWSGFGAAGQSIRVMVESTSKPLEISGSNLTLSNAVGSSIAQGSQFILKPSPKGIQVNSSKMGYDLVKVQGPGLISVGSRKFSKHVHIAWENTKKNSKLLVIHDADLEQYVAGTVASEVPKSWHHEALKAQAIAARTYALKQKYKRSNDPYHVQSSVMDQVFEGAHKLHPKSLAAAKATIGMVITHDRQLIDAFFHSTCGDKTAASKDVWGGDVSYLPGSKCGYCKASSTYRWEAKIPKTQVLGGLSRLVGDQIKSFTIAEKDSAGRAKRMLLKGSRKNHTVSANQFRGAISYRDLKSTWITSHKSSRGGYIFKGKGFGHGVGMCQWGAEGMAKKGHTAPQILARYYPGTQIMRMY